MIEFAGFLIASFSAPEELGTNPQSLLLLVPLVLTIAVVYKATKVARVTAGNFIKESVLLFFSIVIFMVITALILSSVAWFLIR